MLVVCVWGSRLRRERLNIEEGWARGGEEVGQGTSNLISFYRPAGPPSQLGGTASLAGLKAGPARLVWLADQIRGLGASK